MNAEMREMLRWMLSASLIVAVHAGIVAAAAFWQPPLELPDPSGAFVVELAPLPVAREDVAVDIAPAPDQVQAEAAKEKPVETVEQPQSDALPASDAKVALPQAPQPDRPPEEQAPQPPVPTTSISQAASERTAAVAAAPAPGEPRATASQTLPRWASKLSISLERNKRYPAGARDRGEQGITQLSFMIDRSGQLVSSRIVRSSGHPALDAEALDLLRRTQPFPSPPAEVPGAHITLSVPIRFQIR